MSHWNYRARAIRRGYAAAREKRSAISGQPEKAESRPLKTESSPLPPCLHFWSQPDSNGDVQCLYCRAIQQGEAA